MKPLLMALFLLSFSAYAFEKVKINGKMYLAEGFDDNDLVELVMVGELPNSCYKNPTFEIQRRENNKYNIQLFAHYIPHPNGCRQVSVSYIEVINLGMMHAGEYNISLINKNNIENKKLFVQPASSELVDDFLYGNIGGIIENANDRSIELIGVNPVNCLEFDKMSVDMQNSMIVMRPQFKTVGNCEKRPTPFRINYSVPYVEGDPKQILFHVRVMNGRSYNYLYQNRL